jgi:hypothetical protein
LAASSDVRSMAGSRRSPDSAKSGSRGNAATPSYVFFGFEADVTLASYLFEIIDRAMWTEVARFGLPILG